jgi:hypothetical protein
VARGHGAQRAGPLILKQFYLSIWPTFFAETDKVAVSVTQLHTLGACPRIQRITTQLCVTLRENWLFDWMKHIWSGTISRVKAGRDLFQVHILGIRGSSTPGSDTRRMTMRLCLYWSMFFFIWALLTATVIPSDYSVSASVGAITFIGASLLIFIQIVLLMPFRDNNGDFQIDALRLVCDTMISAIFMILVFSVLYKNVGLLSQGEIVRPSSLDAIYFSSVTFSTLGYGDFAPHPSARIIAATQALLGNLHLGMIVGATFAAIRR